MQEIHLVSCCGIFVEDLHHYFAGFLFRNNVLSFSFHHLQDTDAVQQDVSVF
jgi:hypothetical protein